MTVYSFGTGVKKSLKNVVVTYIVPILVLLVAHYTEWLPEDVAIKAAPFMAFVSYVLHNYFKIKNE